MRPTRCKPGRTLFPYTTLVRSTYITRLDTLFQNGLVRYGNSFSIVFFARYAITPYLWSEFGIGYGFRQVTIKGEGINADGYQHFIEVPIKMGFNSINWKGWQALGYVGLEFRQEIAKSTLLKKRKLDEQQLNGYLGLGANYSINKSSSLELNLSLGYNFLRISEQSNNFLYHIELRYIYTIP